MEAVSTKHEVKPAVKQNPPKTEVKQALEKGMRELEGRSLDDFVRKYEVPPEGRKKLEENWAEFKSVEEQPLRAGGEPQDEIARKIDHEAALITGEKKTELLAAAKEGGINRWVPHWWGWDLYLDHDTTQAIVRGMGAGALTFAPALIVSLVLAIGVVIYKTADRGNGVIYSSPWIMLGSAIWVRPQ